jgi:hypothetical protein
MSPPCVDGLENLEPEFGCGEHKASIERGLLSFCGQSLSSTYASHVSDDLFDALSSCSYFHVEYIAIKPKYMSGNDLSHATGQATTTSRRTTSLAILDVFCDCNLRSAKCTEDRQAPICPDSSQQISVAVDRSSSCRIRLPPISFY